MKLECTEIKKGISTKTGFEWSITQIRFGRTLLPRDNGEWEDIVNFNNF
jgi:hypothetical protein